MADIKIPQLGSISTIADSDLLIVDDGINTLKAPAKKVKRYASEEVEGMIGYHEQNPALAPHDTGSQFIYDGKLYTATADIAVGDDIEPGTNCTESIKIIEQIEKIFVGATSLSDGEAGRLPAPSIGDQDKVVMGKGGFNFLTDKSYGHLMHDTSISMLANINQLTHNGSYAINEISQNCFPNFFDYGQGDFDLFLNCHHWVNDAPYYGIIYLTSVRNGATYHWIINIWQGVAAEPQPWCSPTRVLAGMWSENIIYKRGEIVTWSANLWRCKKNHTSSSSILPGNSSTYWEIINVGVTIDSNVVLWDNPALGSAFSAQTIQLPQNSFSHYVVIFKGTKSVGNEMSLIIKKGFTGWMEFVYGQSSYVSGTITMAVRQVLSSSSTSIEFGNGYKSIAGGSSGQDDDVVIPVQVIGLRCF